MEVKKNAFQWLLINLLSFYSKHSKWLMMLNADLLSELLDSPDLVVSYIVSLQEIFLEIEWRKIADIKFERKKCCTRIGYTRRHILEFHPKFCSC